MQRCFVSLAFVAAFIALCLAACSGQGEGQRCSTADDPGGQGIPAGTTDCASGLVCYKAGDLGGAALVYANSAGASEPLGICCPPVRANATTSICAPQSGGSTLDAAFPSPDSSPPPDSGSTDAPILSDGPSASDAGDAARPTDAPGTDAPADALTDAPTDAPATDAPADAPAG